MLKKQKHQLKKKIFKYAFRKSGMALIELVIVIAIIGILAAVSIPNLGFYKEYTKEMKVNHYEMMLNQKLRLYYVEEGKAISSHSDDKFYMITNQIHPEWMDLIKQNPYNIQLKEGYQYRFMIEEGNLYGSIKVKEK